MTFTRLATSFVRQRFPFREIRNLGNKKTIILKKNGFSRTRSRGATAGMSGPSIEAPYTIASLPNPLDAKNGQIQASPIYGVKGSKKRKRPEVAVGIDGEGLNIYNVILAYSSRCYATNEDCRYKVITSSHLTLYLRNLTCPVHLARSTCAQQQAQPPGGAPSL